jgi:hypothetical protein
MDPFIYISDNGYEKYTLDPCSIILEEMKKWKQLDVQMVMTIRSITSRSSLDLEIYQCWIGFMISVECKMTSKVDTMNAQGI